jgi:hypothetical protein
LLAVQERSQRDRNSDEYAYGSGRVNAFNEVISLVQQEARGFGIPLAEMGLADIEPDRDLM